MEKDVATPESKKKKAKASKIILPPMSGLAYFPPYNIFTDSLLNDRETRSLL